MGRPGLSTARPGPQQKMNIIFVGAIPCGCPRYGLHGGRAGTGTCPYRKPLKHPLFEAALKQSLHGSGGILGEIAGTGTGKCLMVNHGGGHLPVIIHP